MKIKFFFMFFLFNYNIINFYIKIKKNKLFLIYSYLIIKYYKNKNI